MPNGLNLFQSNGNNILLDADNLFWTVMPGIDNSNAFIPRDILSLYAKVKDRLDTEMNDFRFSQELSAVYIDPTDKCNAQCPYCYIPPRTRHSGRSLSKDELALILEKIANYFQNKKRKAVIVFHASEPLLVKELIFEAIRNYSPIFKFGLQTNALLMESKDVEFLKEYEVGVGISLDSHSPLINNRLRPALKAGGNFSSAVRAIEWFDGYAGLNVITTITKFNVQDLPGLVKFLSTKKVPCVLFNPLRLTQRNSHPLKPDEKLLSKYFIKAIDSAVDSSRTGGHKIIIGNFANIILGIIAPTARRLMCDISPCGAGRCFLTITASGSMIPCGEFIGLPGFSGGNIFKDTIEKAMGSGPFKQIRARFVEKIPECNSCRLRNICGAPCPAELHALGNMYKKSVFCEFYQELISHAFKLIAEGKEKYLLRKEGWEGLEYAYKI